MAGPQEYDVYVSCDPTADKWGHELQATLGRQKLRAFVADLPKWDPALESPLRHARAVVFCTASGELTPRMREEVAHAGYAAMVLPIVAGPLPRELHPWSPFARQLGSTSPNAFAQQIALMLTPPARSSSVGSVIRNLDGQVPASAIVWELFKVHPEYAGKRGGDVRLSEDPGDRVFPAETWLVAVRALFTNKEPELHGRTVIVGLALLEPRVRDRLQQQDGLFDSVAAELPLKDILSSRGAELLRAAATPSHHGDPPPSPPPLAHEAAHDSVPLHTDNPAVVDQLNRKGFARVLAQRIRDMRVMETKAARPKSEFPRGRAFLVHLNGRWGAGKTSLLNFVQEELEQGNTVPPFRVSDAAAEPWIVVNFNAWQHQRIVPPWWWLMGNVYRQGLKELWRIDKRRAVWFWLREWLWRAQAGWPWYLLAVAAAGSAAVLWSLDAFKELAHPHAQALTIASGLVSLAIVLFGVIRGVARSMLSSSTRGAREYIQNTRDPMETAKRHFADLIGWLHYPVAVFVDDLDRCKGDYIVQLLEGVQTLFRDVPVVYVVAADRDWLSDSYAVEYSAFVSLTDEPGRPLGYLFLEKTFQLTAAVHDLDQSALPSFWEGLVHAGAMPDEDELRDERIAAHNDLKPLSAEETRDAVLNDPGATPAQKQARVEEMAIKMATHDVQEERQHVLPPFSELLERNPRALKRLVNAFGVARDLERLSGRNLGEDLVAEHETALWTILNLRWPRLAEYLAEHPEHIELIERKEAPDDAPEDLKPLFRDDRVLAVVEGKAPNVHARLDSEVVGAFAGRR